MLRKNILRTVGGSVSPTEIVDFGSFNTSSNSSSTPSFSVSANYSAGDILVMLSFAYDSTINIIEQTTLGDQQVNNLSLSGELRSVSQRDNTNVLGLYYVATTSGTSLSVDLAYTSTPQNIYCAIYVLRASSTNYVDRGRQTWTLGTSEGSISYEDGISAIVGIAVYREYTNSNITTPFTVTSTVGTVNLESSEIIDGGNAGVVAFNLPYTETTGSSSLTLTSDDNLSGFNYSYKAMTFISF